MCRTTDWSALRAQRSAMPKQASTWPASSRRTPHSTNAFCRSISLLPIAVNAPSTTATACPPAVPAPDPSHPHEFSLGHSDLQEVTTGEGGGGGEGGDIAKSSARISGVQANCICLYTSVYTYPIYIPIYSPIYILRLIRMKCDLLSHFTFIMAPSTTTTACPGASPPSSQRVNKDTVGLISPGSLDGRGGEIYSHP